MLVAWGAIPGSSGIFSRMDESHRVTVFGEGHDDWQVSHSPERKQSSWGDLSGAGRRGRDGWAVRSGGLEGGSLENGCRHTSWLCDFGQLNNCSESQFILL